MSQQYEPEFRKNIIRLRLEEGRIYKSTKEEYGVAKSAVFKWCAEFSEECRSKAEKNPMERTELDPMRESLRLRKELEETKKENLFLKKRRHSLRRDSIRSLPVPGSASGGIRHPLAASAAFHLPKRISQLPQATQSRLSRCERSGPLTNSSTLSPSQWRSRLSHHDRAFAA